MTIEKLLTKIAGVMIGTGVILALGTAMAHAQAFCS
jgi:hypothetical protein